MELVKIMKEVKQTEQVLKLCKALGSEIRLNILKLLEEHKHMNLNELSEKLQVTNGAMTSHIKLLHEADVIGIQHASGKRGAQKTCFLKESRFLIDMVDDSTPNSSYETEIPVGSYTNYEIAPTCGIATNEHIIGELDDSRYFDSPERVNAHVLWFAKGFIEYRVPNYLKQSQSVSEIQLSFEISSEAPGICEDWPSDIRFSVNGIDLGFWTSPGDFGKVNGLYTPSWWLSVLNQYGLLKLLSINQNGCFIDGTKISDVTIDDLNLDYKSNITFRFAVDEKSNHVGGLTLFGRNFGNYNQDIKVRVIFSQNSQITN